MHKVSPAIILLYHCECTENGATPSGSAPDTHINLAMGVIYIMGLAYFYSQKMFVFCTLCDDVFCTLSLPKLLRGSTDLEVCQGYALPLGPCCGLSTGCLP